MLLKNIISVLRRDNMITTNANQAVTETSALLFSNQDSSMNAVQFELL